MLFKMPTRYSVRLKAFGMTLFALMAKTQTCEGITSEAGNGKYFLFFDIDGKPQSLVIKELRRLQKKFKLSDMFIVSDKELSFRVFCYSRFSLIKMVHILTALPDDFLDWQFIHWTVERGKATLRTGAKANRPKMKVVAVLRSYSVPIPKTCTQVIYDTGTSKIGKLIILGDKEANKRLKAKKEAKINA
jgi:hypothetical protein